MRNGSAELKTYSFFAFGQLLIGIMGIALGFWVEFFRPSSPGELMINRSLIFYSIGFVVSAVVLFTLIKKAKG